MLSQILSSSLEQLDRGGGGLDLYMAGWRIQCEFVQGDASRSGQKLNAACLSIIQFSFRTSPARNDVTDFVLTWQGVLIGFQP